MKTTDFVWIENCKPDRPGIWAYKGDDGEPRAISIRNEDERQATWPGAWCRLGDLPEIKDPPRYREVTAADVGREVEVSNNELWWTVSIELVAVHQGKYVVHQDGRYLPFNHARILDDGEPAKQPREWWFVPAGNGTWLRFGSPHDNAAGQIHVREVIDE